MARFPETSEAPSPAGQALATITAGRATRFANDSDDPSSQSTTRNPLLTRRAPVDEGEAPGTPGPHAFSPPTADGSSPSDSLFPEAPSTGHDFRAATRTCP